LWSTRGKYRTEPKPTGQDKTIRRTLTGENRKKKKQKNSTVKTISKVKRQFKLRSSSRSEKAVRVGVQEPSQPNR
jgi:hypothetical protein